MIKIRHKGNFKNTEKLLNRGIKVDTLTSILMRYGEEGVSALSSATPVNTGKTADSWSYVITRSPNSISIHWTNSNVVNGVPIAIILQYGHGTRNGGYVIGRDYINPTIRPIFDKISNAAWEEVIGA